MFQAAKFPLSSLASSSRQYDEYLPLPAHLTTTAVKACREIEFCLAPVSRSAIRFPPEVRAFALTGERDPTVRLASAERMAITARSSIKEYPRETRPNRGDRRLAIGSREMGVNTIHGFLCKMQEKFRVYCFCFDRLVAP
jgi:hypothetical protein